MAIKRGIRRALAEVGKIKTGYKGKEVVSKNGNKFRPPKKLDHFVVTTTERDADGNLMKNKEVMEKLGDKPKELKIRLPFDSIDKNFFTQYQYYSGNKRLCSGDGEKAERRVDLTVKGNTITPGKEHDHIVECDPESCPIFATGKCKVSGILSAFLPQSGDLGGVYRFRTHSYNSVASILGALEYFASQTGGILQGMPLKLVMVKKTTTEHGTINYATVVIDGQEIHGLRRLAVEERESRLLLGTDIESIEKEAEASGFFEDTDSEEEVQGEYYPEDDVAGEEQAEEIAEELDARNVTPQPDPAKDSNDLF